MSRKNVEVIRRLNEAFNAEDWATWEELIASDAHFVDHLPLPDVAREAHGRDELTKVLDQWREGFVGFRADVMEYLDLGDYVVCESRWRFVSRDNQLELDWAGAEAHQLRDGKLIWSAAGFRDVRAAIDAVERRRTERLPAPESPPGTSAS